MNSSKISSKRLGMVLATATMTAMFLAACVTTPQSPPGAAEVRAKLTRLQASSELAGRAPIEIREAETAVRLAEIPVPKDPALGVHRVYLADYKVEIAEAKASTRYAEDQRAQLGDLRDKARLHARTLEAERARDRADLARSDAARAEAGAARASAATATAEAAQRRSELALYEADQAREAAAADARRDKAELQRQIDLLQARPTERGLVLTLGNVLFASGRADLTMSGKDSLNNLIAFLNQYRDRSVVIEGHTDNIGSNANNLALSTRRAESVKSYLLQQGVGRQRVTSSGMGETRPIANNDTESGRQQNRRVEVIILDNAQQISAASSSHH
jgi:outer membrane protein OmpA-like peptidoglycan-associated protein